MKVIVITGSTRGIGYGLADAFLNLDCSVTISGRTPAAVDQAVSSLADRHGAERIMGQPCDVTQFEQVQSLWNVAQAHFGQIDIWINNAGISHPQMDFWTQPPELLRSVVETNVLGAMHGAVVSLAGMTAQGFGSLYNMEGLGSDGRMVDGLTLYGTTKHGLKYLTDALAREVKDTPVIVGAIRPGMVLTNLLTDQYVDRPEEWEKAKPIFNILVDRVETVAPWMAKRVLENTRNGRRISWFNRWKMMGRFLMAPFRKRDLFA